MSKLPNVAIYLSNGLYEALKKLERKGINRSKLFQELFRNYLKERGWLKDEEKS